MSDEEKQAIERLNKRYEFFKENPLATNVWLTLDIHNLGIALNLIEKQSKEIEILNKNMNLLREQNISYKQSIHGLKEMNKIINKKWEDKIKAKIEELEKQDRESRISHNYLVIPVLHSLLE